MQDENEDNLKNKEDLHIAGRHMALDIFRFAVFFVQNIWSEKILVLKSFGSKNSRSKKSFGQNNFGLKIF